MAQTSSVVAREDYEGISLVQIIILTLERKESSSNCTY